jgi:hypothetical protein
MMFIFSVGNSHSKHIIMSFNSVKSDLDKAVHLTRFLSLTVLVSDTSRDLLGMD